MLISDKTIRTIKDNVDCRNLIKSFGVKYNGQNISCSELNANHEDKNPSMAIYHDHALCFSCGFNADAIKIVQKFKSYTFNDAVEYICKNYNIQIEYQNKKVENNTKSLDIIDKIWELSREIEITNNFINWMKKRNINIQIAYQEGCRDIFPIRSKLCELIKKCSDEELKLSGLINSKNELWKPFAEIIRGNKSYNGFIIPVFNSNNKIVNLRYRLYENINFKTEKGEKTIKIYAQPGASNHILGLNHLEDNKDSLYICEGEPDYLSLKTYFHLNNINNADVLAYCVLTKDWKDSYNNELKKYKNIKICLHNTPKAKAISDIIHGSLISSCRDNKEIEYWKNNFYEHYFDEKLDINDHLVQGKLQIENINFEVKKYPDKNDNINDKDTNVFDSISSVSWNSDWIFKTPDKEKAILRSLNNDLVIPQSDVGLFVAAGGTGKTQLLMQLVVSLATETHWLNAFKKGDSSGKILFAFGEENTERIQRRFQRIFIDLKLNESMRKKFIENVVFLSLHKIEATFSNGDNSFQNKLKSFITKHTTDAGWSLIILDPASRFLPRDAEIDNASATSFIRECEKLTDLPGKPTILISHHVNKSSMNGAKLFSEENDSNQSASRGASGLVDGARFVLNIDSVLKEDWLKNTNFYNKKLLKIKHSKINCGPFMCPINAVVDDNGVIYALSESEEEELKTIKSSFNSGSSGKSSSPKNQVYI